MICSWCNRRLPTSSFGLKTGATRSRYKVCISCREAGHSCVKQEKPKAPRKKMTPEERIAHKREYQRQYCAKHREQVREWQRDSYQKRKQGIKGKPGPKPKKEKPVKPEPATRVCVVCGRELPAVNFYSRDGKRTNSVVCLDCRPEPTPKVKKPAPVPVKLTPDEKGCINCRFYPCFQGIDNLESDLSKTCRSFKYKDVS